MIVFDKSFLDTFTTIKVRVEDLDRSGRYTRSLAAANGANTYRLRNHSAFQTRSNDLLSVHGVRQEGDLLLCRNIDNFATDIAIIGNGHARYCLVIVLSGTIEMVAGPYGKAAAHGTKGMIFRGLPGSRFLTSDDSARFVLWIEAKRLERTLQARLGEPPRAMLAFSPGIDWSSGQARAVQRMIVHLAEELRDPNGIATDLVARETFTDLLVHTLLTRLEHNYTVQLARPTAAAVPGHLRRAEAFMHACAGQPIKLADVAAAAGCATGTLHAAFRQFRSTTPLAWLHTIRLQHACEALRKADDQESTRTIARRFGFTNPSRFIAAYGRQFGEHPNETRRRAEPPWSAADANAVPAVRWS